MAILIFIFYLAGLIFSIGFARFVLRKFGVDKNAAAFGLGHLGFMALAYGQILLFPDFQEWRPLFLIPLDLPSSLLVAFLSDLDQPLKYGVIALLGTIQYFIIGYCIDRRKMKS